MIVLSESLKTYLNDPDIFKALAALPGKVYREKDGRKTFRASMGEKYYFIKLYQGIGWIELLKSLLRFRLPILSARNEWKAIQCLHELGIETMTVAGYGSKGWLPAHRLSFLITDELTATRSLENVCREWPSSPPDAVLKRTIIRRVADVTRMLHGNKLVHRDMYICHFLLDISMQNNKNHRHTLHLYLIDLHRMRKTILLKKRSAIKDLAALYFSSMDIGLTQRDILRFIRAYKSTPIKSALRNKTFWHRVRRRAIFLYIKANGRNPLPFF